jgi:peptide/nickel transport system substrate-binding protein
MNQKQKGLSLIVIIILISIVVLGIISYDLSKSKGSVESLTFKKVEQINAKQALLNGDIDMYFGSLSGEDIKELQNNSAITLYPATSTMLGLFVNPYFSTAKFNPFSIKEVRYAMQFLVNREDLANNLFAGFAKLTLTSPWSEHPDYKNIKDSVDKMQIVYDKEKALSLIKTGMNNSGAIMESGIWTYNKQPINVIVSYYSGAKALGIANSIKSSLESVGFTVTLTKKDENDPNAQAIEDSTNATELQSVTNYQYCYS